MSKYSTGLSSAHDCIDSANQEEEMHQELLQWKVDKLRENTKRLATKATTTGWQEPSLGESFTKTPTAKQ